jgi:hypothetical protein
VVRPLFSFDQEPARQLRLILAIVRLYRILQLDVFSFIHVHTVVRPSVRGDPGIQEYVPSLITLKEFVDDEEAVEEEATSTVSIRSGTTRCQSDPNNRNAEWYAATIQVPAPHGTIIIPEEGKLVVRAAECSGIHRPRLNQDLQGRHAH